MDVLTLLMLSAIIIIVIAVVVVIYRITNRTSKSINLECNCSKLNGFSIKIKTNEKSVSPSQDTL